MKIAKYLVCVLAVAWPLVMLGQEYKFNHIDVGHGLSNNQVTTFLKDRTGFIWIGTHSALNRFDGYSIKVFRNDPSDSTSLLHDFVEALFELPDGRMGVRTPSGICLYNPKDEKFTTDLSSFRTLYQVEPTTLSDVVHDNQGNFWFIDRNSGVVGYNDNRKISLSIRNDPQDSATIASPPVTCFVPHNDGSYWVVHSNGILEKLKINQNSARVVSRSYYLNKRLDANSYVVGKLLVDSDGDLWLNVSNDNLGVYFFDLTRNLVHHLNKETSKEKLASDLVSGIVQDNKGLIWIATDHGGINVFDKRANKMRYLLHDSENGKSLGQNSITQLYKDDDGIIWAGTYKKGVSYHHESISRFPLYNRYAEPEPLPFEDVNRFVEDQQGNIWIGTNGGGLLYFNRQSGRFTSFKNDPANPNSISSNVIVSLCIDHENKLWIGTYFGGLSCYDGKKFTNYNHDPRNPHSLSSRNVWEIYEDSKHRLWVGTLGGGLDLYDRKTHTFTHYNNNDQQSVRSPYISVITEDSEGNLWVGTSAGIDVLQNKTGEFIHYEAVKNDPRSLRNSIIQDIREDSKGRLWVGTQGGLSLFNRSEGTFKTFTDKDGLPNNSILNILDDGHGQLWVSTPNGLSNAVVTGNGVVEVQFRNYTEADGLQGLQFNENAAFRTSKGELIFGGANGFNLFKPENLRMNQRKPKVILSDFQLFNHSLKPGENVDGNIILTKSITETPPLVLPASKNVFSIEFAALNFFQPEKNTYKYKLEGFNQNWLYTDSKSRKVTFTNLDPGDYTFKVMATNNDGVWSDEGASLHIKVLPPFWKSSTAFVLYAVLIILALMLTRKLIQQREQMKFAIRQERQEALRMHELDMMKIKFFTNVSHEFRTPLTLILTPLERLLKNTEDQEQKKQFDLIQRNARRLLNLVNQLLDFRKMEVQEIKFQPSEGDIIKFIHETVYSFSDLSEKKDIRLEFQSSVSSLETIFDQDKLEKILFNLLSNAFKFTLGKGTVSVDVDVKNNNDGKWIQINVRDTGIGISKEKQDRIFERFFQNELPRSMVNQGSGIGLSITKEFVKIHGGTIVVESEPGQGSCFTVTLPITEIEQTVVEHNAEAIALTAAEPEDHPVLHVHDHAEQVLLLVEDNEDFRFYLKDNLKQSYRIIEARNGQEGWKMVLAHFPDLIVSDVMMPEMNGLELCAKVKSDRRVSHIPVILLTARTSDDQKIEGIETGADDYINKPFNFEILESRIRNLIVQREKLHKTLSKYAGIKASELQITSLDEQFIKNAIHYVEKNVSNADFTVEDLSRELGVSRAHFFKKITALTGKSPLEFIRTIRMQQAAQLLEKSQLTVAEVAYRVGFNNPKYFTKYFKEIYHVLPSAYAAGKRRNNVV
jgi:signal transduction histidine kinase/ligand-binding sensor domain-containing protein/DNA-binding response OmpR family regulator